MLASSFLRVAAPIPRRTFSCSCIVRTFHGRARWSTNRNRERFSHRFPFRSYAAFAHGSTTPKRFAVAGLMCTGSVALLAFACKDRYRLPVVLAEGSSSFIVPSGHLAGKYDAVYISTDLEADDIVAFKALAPKLRGVPLFVVVGEGSIDGKSKMAAELLAYYQIDDCATVIEGRRSSEKYPQGALSAFASSKASKARIIDGDATKESELFLRSCQAPLAILLKPPHEMIGISSDVLKKTAAVAYGSFNFIRLRNEISTTDKEAAARGQENLIAAFKRFLWIERSLTVGSNGVLNSNQAAWKYFADDVGLMKVVYEWSSASVVRTSKTISSMSKKVRDLCQKEGDDVLATAETFAEVAKAFQKAEKSIAILQDIANMHGNQICLADPIIAAVLADTKSKLKSYEKVVSFTLNSKGSPSFVSQQSGPVAILNAGGKTDDILQAILYVLEEMMS